MSYQAFLEEAEVHWDEKVGLLAGVSGEPYHLSRIPAGQRIHSLLNSLYYAWALLKSGKPEFVRRASRVMEVVFSQQDLDTASASYGAWSHYF
jgi:hypothetical protein